MKTCKMCARMLPLSEFSRKSADRPSTNSYCKACQREYSRRHYAQNRDIYGKNRSANQLRYRDENRARVQAFIRDKACVDCGETDSRVLEFDHVMGEKAFSIGDAISQRSWKQIERELQKCHVRCANCHRRKTAIELGWFRSHFEGM